MRDFVAHNLKRALGACFAVALGATPMMAADNPLDAELRQQLRAFDKMVEVLPEPGIQAAALITQAGLADYTNAVAAAAPLAAPPSTEKRMPQAKSMDLRLSLGLIAQIYGAKDNFDVLFAQEDQSYPALVIDSGDITVTDIFDLLAREGLQDDLGAGQNLLKRPVIIWGDAALNIGPNETLRMSQTHGAFLINFGRLVIEGARIEVVGDVNAGAPDFRPFIANAGGASIRARNSHFKGLGFGNEMKFSGFSVVRNPLLVRKDEILIENNTFEDIAGVGVSMADGVSIRNNRVHNTRSASIAVTHSVGARIIGNLVTGDAPTNAIRLLQGSSNGRIEGNVVLGGDRAGIVVRNDSNRVSVRNNVVWRRGGGGISFKDVNCAIAEHNIVMDNRQKGIEVRTTRDMVVRENLIIGNKSSGVWVSAQKEGAATLIADNVLLGNGSGLASATGATLVLTGNDLTKQFPRFLDGDLSTQTRVISADLKGETALVLTAGGTLGGPPPEVGCTQ